jgi:single-stranded-DNA-specific exonuclease
MRKSETQKANSGLLAEAKKPRRKVLVYGDYDTDGIMSASIMVRALREFGLTREGYLPSRYKDGYGLTAENVDKIADKGFKMIFTTIMGSPPMKPWMKPKNGAWDVIILDHHEIGEKAPEALAVHPTPSLMGTPRSRRATSPLFSRAPCLKKKTIIF